VPPVEDSFSWHDAIPKKGSLCQENAILLVVQRLYMCYGCYANGFRFDSHLADLRFVLFFLLFFNFCLGITFRDY